VVPIGTTWLIRLNFGSPRPTVYSPQPKRQIDRFSRFAHLTAVLSGTLAPPDEYERTYASLVSTESTIQMVYRYIDRFSRFAQLAAQGPYTLQRVTLFPKIALSHDEM